MKAFTRIGILAGLIALTFLISPGVTRAQNSQGCAGLFKRVTGEPAAHRTRGGNRSYLGLLPPRNPFGYSPKIFTFKSFRPSNLSIPLTVSCLHSAHAVFPGQ